MASTDKHYSNTLEAQLRSLLKTGDWDRVVRRIETMSNSESRTAGYLLGERLMPELGADDFWALACVLVSHNSKAYLVTVLKCAAVRGVDVECEGFARMCQTLRGNKIDVEKTLKLLLPILDKPQHIASLFTSLGVSDPHERLASLLGVSTEAASYSLLHTLKSLDHEKALLTRVVRFLMKRGDNKSYNLASMLKTYFGLNDVRGVFSREIEPYKLAKLAESYDAFRTMLNR